MAINDRYRKFVPHADNVQEVISADHVNELQRQAEVNAETLFKQADTDFLQKALFTLEHHVSANSMFADLIEDTTKLDLVASPGIEFSQEGRQVYLAEDRTSGTLTTKAFQNTSNTAITDIIFMADVFVPPGTSLNFEISSNNGMTWYPVPTIGTMFSISGSGSALKVRAKFLRPLGQPGPTLNGYAILYRDPKYNVELSDTMPPIGEDGAAIHLLRHDELIGIGPDDHHEQVHKHDGTDGSGTIDHAVLKNIGPDDHHAKDHKHGQDGVGKVVLDTDVAGTLPMEMLSSYVFTGLPGPMQLIRNPNAQDKLIWIIGPEEETFLFYDVSKAGRLDSVMTVRGDIATWEKMHYRPYTNQVGKTQEVFMGTTKTIRDVQEAEVQAAILSVTGIVMEPDPDPFGL